MLKLLVLLTLTYDALALIPSIAVVEDASARILEKINAETLDSNAGTEFPLLAGFVRLAFHDCIGNGGCDGCIDHAAVDNAGLERYTIVLDQMYDNYYSDVMSRADFYALASIVALEKSTESSQVKFQGRNNLLFGREDCSTSPSEDSLNVFPNSMGNINDILGYFSQQFSLNPRQTVALLGAHTLGRAHVENSVYEGRWVRDVTASGVHPASVLDNQYYIEMRRPWAQVSIQFGGATKKQWQPPRTPPNTVDSRTSPNQPPMFFNSDMCFLIDFTVTDDIGTSSCNFCPPGGRGRGPGNCCPESVTADIVNEYARDNALWVNDFTDVFMSMISRNTNSQLQAAGSSEPDPETPAPITESPETPEPITETPEPNTETPAPITESPETPEPSTETPEPITETPEPNTPEPNTPETNTPEPNTVRPTRPTRRSRRNRPRNRRPPPPPVRGRGNGGNGRGPRRGDEKSPVNISEDIKLIKQKVERMMKDIMFN